MASDSNIKIKDLSEQDRPREKMLSQGHTSLTDSELIGILIGSGTVGTSSVDLAKSILRNYNNNLADMLKTNVGELCKFKGIGPAKAVEIMAAFEIARRVQATRPTEKPQISNSLDAFHVIKTYLADIDHEEVWMMMLNRSNRLISVDQISSGGIASSIVDIRIAMKRAISASASAVVLVHNHPSGNMKPSKQDDDLTERIHKACSTLDIRLNDHIIIGPMSTTQDNYYSYNDNDRL